VSLSLTGVSAISGAGAISGTTTNAAVGAGVLGL